MSIEDEIVEWNIKCLPENTLTMQLEKVIEEQKELSLALNGNDEIEIMYEWADVYISIIGLRRFNVLASYNHLSLFYFAYNVLGFFEDIKPYVEKKFDIIKKRHYVKKNGVYRHTEVN